MNVQFTVQQDNAPAHVAKQTEEFLQQRFVKPWPAKSPDLNIVEKYEHACQKKCNK